MLNHLTLYYSLMENEEKQLSRNLVVVNHYPTQRVVNERHVHQFEFSVEN